VVYLTRVVVVTLVELGLPLSQLAHGEKMASIGRFVAGIAHELNNPVGFVLGNMHFLQTYTGALSRMLDAYRAHGDQLDGAAADHLEELRAELDLDYIIADIPSLFEGCVEGIQRAMSLVRDLRTFSRIDQSDCWRSICTSRSTPRSTCCAAASAWCASSRTTTGCRPWSAWPASSTTC
jgi:signal transduction histidine kinase